ncbi:MAG: hypothetical protein GY832_01470 [Chloroflexi bacterium]|nr:hypothetical protein [Chloroflexota bacterium]
MAFTAADAQRIHERIDKFMELQRKTDAAVSRIEGSCAACRKIVMGNGKSIDSRMAVVEAEKADRRRISGWVAGVVSGVVVGVVVVVATHFFYTH